MKQRNDEEDGEEGRGGAGEVSPHLIQPVSGNSAATWSNEALWLLVLFVVVQESFQLGIAKSGHQLIDLPVT